MQYPGPRLTDDIHQGLTTSICEEALSRFRSSDDSLAGIIAEQNISVRDFMLLSLVCDQTCFDLDQLARALGLKSADVHHSVERLTAARLLFGQDDQRVCVSDAGRELTRRILGTLENPEQGS